MKIRIATYYLLFISALLVMPSTLLAQNGKQKELEAKRIEFRREIKKINALVSQNKSKQKSEISLIENINYKVNVIKNLIKVTNQQANLLTREINNNQKNITLLRDELKALKKSYASMLEKSYKNKNSQNRVMFLLSAENFKQAYKRIQYLNQYTKYQKQQGEVIKAKTQDLQAANTLLLAQNKEKKKLIEENKSIKKELDKEVGQHKTIMSSIKKSLGKYKAQIREKQSALAKIDKEIDAIIKAEIAKSNKKAGKPTTSKSKSSFALTAESKALAKDFLSNKGKLPWPVQKGIVKLGYGVQRSPIDKSVTINSTGVRIATEKGAKVRAVFNGEVMSIIRPKRSNPIVLIKHGNYITTYQNLGKLYVKVGDKVTTKQEIGEVFTNKTTGETILKFRIDKDNKTQNPSSWIYKM